MRGVTYGTFAPREDGLLFPETDRLKTDFVDISESGFNTIRTYTCPPDDLLALASDWGLKVVAGVFYEDWRYMLGASRKQRSRVMRAASAEIRSAARRLSGNETVAAICLGNEIPADVVRWVGTKGIAAALSDLVEIVKEEDPEMLVTYANYPTAEYLPLNTVDFLTFNVFLERQTDFRRYLTRLQHLAADRPLVLGEVGMDSGGCGPEAQAAAIDWQLSTAIERGVGGTFLFSWTDEWVVGGVKVEGWHFGLTDENRLPKPALEVAKNWNQRTVRDLNDQWPAISVIVCAHNEEQTIGQCLHATTSLDYPNLEIIVVDDGSTDATAQIAAGFESVKLVQTPRGGLGNARNLGFKAATEDLIAYLDADAFPDSEWPYYLVLGMDSRDLGVVGGPNFPPETDSASAKAVARSPGGPVHVMFNDDRAEHVPGCNMAFWRQVLEEIGGFDPVYVSAGDDVDACWKVLDRGWQIGFHPTAFIWHRSRGGMLPYLKQQKGYGLSEAVVEARHPDRFTALGTARWRGRIYDSLVPRPARQRVYHGVFGSAAYQSVYGGGGHLLDILHQVGLPAAAIALCMLPLSLLDTLFALPALAAALFVATLGLIDATKVLPPRNMTSGRMKLRATVAMLNVLQPLVRTWGRLRARSFARRDLPNEERIPGPMQRIGRTTMLLPAEMSRPELVSALIAALRKARIRVSSSTGWENHDALLLGSLLVSGRLLTSSYPEGAVQVQVRRRLRIWPVVSGALSTAIAWQIGPALAVAIIGAYTIDLIRGIWRTGPKIRRIFDEAVAEDETRLKQEKPAFA